MRILLTEIGNASPGDEAIVLAAAKRLIQLGCQLTVAYRVSLIDSFLRAGLVARHIPIPIERLGSRYESSDQLLNAVQANHPILFENLIQAVTSVDLVCVAPGGKYLNGFDNSAKLLTLAVAQKVEIPYIILHQSVGPLHDKRDLKLLAEVFSGSRLIIARELNSYQFLTSFLPDKSKVIYAGDVAMNEIYPKESACTYSLGVNLRWSELGHSTIGGLEAFVLNYRQIVPNSSFLIYSTTTDLPSSITKLAAKLGLAIEKDWARYPDYLGVIGKCRANLTDSFHGVIFSLKAKVPAICLQPDMGSWKLSGLRGPCGEVFKIFAGLKNDGNINLITLEAARLTVSDLYRNNAIKIQDIILNECGRRAEYGWQAVRDAIEDIRLKNAKPNRS